MDLRLDWFRTATSLATLYLESNLGVECGESPPEVAKSLSEANLGLSHWLVFYFARHFLSELNHYAATQNSVPALRRNYHLMDTWRFCEV